MCVIACWSLIVGFWWCVLMVPSSTIELLWFCQFNDALRFVFQPPARLRTDFCVSWCLEIWIWTGTLEHAEIWYVEMFVESKHICAEHYVLYILDYWIWTVLASFCWFFCRTNLGLKTCNFHCSYLVGKQPGFPMIITMMILLDWTMPSNRCVNINMSKSGRWFGTCFIFPYIGNVIIQTDLHMFQRGGSTTNQK